MVQRFPTCHRLLVATIGAALISIAGASNAHAGVIYWNLFNLEGESALNSLYHTYATLDDMLNDENRLDIAISPDGGGGARNVIGSGAAFFPDSPVPIPVPPASWLFLAALCGLGLFGRHRGTA